MFSRADKIITNMAGAFSIGIIVIQKSQFEIETQSVTPLLSFKFDLIDGALLVCPGFQLTSPGL